MSVALLRPSTGPCEDVRETLSVEARTALLRALGDKTEGIHTIPFGDTRISLKLKRQGEGAGVDVAIEGANVVDSKAKVLPQPLSFVDEKSQIARAKPAASEARESVIGFLNAFTQTHAQPATPPELDRQEPVALTPSLITDFIASLRGEGSKLPLLHKDQKSRSRIETYTATVQISTSAFIRLEHNETHLKLHLNQTGLNFPNVELSIPLAEGQLAWQEAKIAIRDKKESKKITPPEEASAQLAANLQQWTLKREAELIREHTLSQLINRLRESLQYLSRARMETVAEIVGH